MEEWTDGKVTIQKIPVPPYGEFKYRFFLYGQERTEPKKMQDLFGYLHGPWLETDRIILPLELDLIMNNWIQSIASERVQDIHIVTAIQILIQGALPNGFAFRRFTKVHNELLHNLPNILIQYMQRQVSMSSLEAESLATAMSNLSF